MRFTLFVPSCVHQRIALPTKECFIMLSDLSMELPFRRGWNQALFMWNATFEIRTSPWLTKMNYWKSTPAMPTFVWRMDEKQPSRFGIFHLECSWCLSTKCSHPLTPLWRSTSWWQLYVKWRRQGRYCFYRQFVWRLRKSVSCKKRWT